MGSGEADSFRGERRSKKLQGNPRFQEEKESEQKSVSRISIKESLFSLSLFASSYSSLLGPDDLQLAHHDIEVGATS